ncbi:MAG: sigma-70 family RNA polymerase sigma factor [Candidatus Izemoplasmatales bacterium]|nr:sigma-70 family RNA polymerase sigma factor [Candidatus Izemoplasmatales bacterium]
MTENIPQQHVEQLVKTYYPLFISFAKSRLSSRHDAEDLAQDIMIACYESLKRNPQIENINAYLWSIAHYTLQRWYSKKKWVLTDDVSSFTNVVHEQSIGLEPMILEEERMQIRHEILHLSQHIRQTMISFYFEGMSMADIAEDQMIPLSKVKYYLFTGKSKIKENMMNPTQTLLRPEELHLYKSAIDFSSVNLWSVYQRTLPRQIALLCHGTDLDVTDLSMSTGVPAMYLEEELQLLMQSGTMKSTNQKKYRTNFHILSSSKIEELVQLFHAMHEDYFSEISNRWQRDLDQLKSTDLFQYEASDQQYAWFYANQIPDSMILAWQDEEYPQILSCGSRAFIFAAQAKEFRWSMGATPTEIEGVTIWGSDCLELGIEGNQALLHRHEVANALWDLCRGLTKPEDEELYAELIQKGMATRIEGAVYTTLPISTPKSRAFMTQIQHELYSFISPKMEELFESATKIIAPTIPHDLKPYTNGYVKTWISFLAGVTLKETLYKKGFLKLPKDRESAPGFSFIYQP